MKKIIAVILSLLMFVGIAGASAEGLGMLGAWSVSESAEITEEQQAVFDQAMEKLVGVSYSPIAYLGSQLVSGTNHCFLCKSTVIYPNAEPTLVLVYIYEDLQGNAEITHFADLDLAALSTDAE